MHIFVVFDFFSPNWYIGTNVNRKEVDDLAMRKNVPSVLLRTGAQPVCFVAIINNVVFKVM